MKPTSNPKTMLSRLLVLIVLMGFTANTLYAQNKIALLIGISNYPQYKDADASWTKIHGTNDVQLISPLLAKQGFNIITLTDNTATHKGIENGFKKLENSVRPGDIVYIHFSGHGQAVEDENGDEADGWDEAFIPYDAQHRYKKGVYQGENHLLDDELNSHLNSIRKKVGEKGVVYVVIDACHAGSSYRGEEEDDSVYVRGTDIGFSKNRKPYSPPIDKRGNIRVSSGKGMSHIYMLEACRSYQVNTEIKENGQYCGPLSYYISQQLLTTRLSFDTKWIEEVRKNMENDSRLKFPRQQNMVTESSL